MLVLLSDGAGLAARQSATLLSRAGHRVEALTADPLCLCGLTRHVHKLHRVPALGADPLGWLEAALEVAGRRQADILLPVQEQVAVMSLARERIASAGLLTAVPDFAALRQVQDKVTAFGTLARLGLPQPRASVISSLDALESIDELPVFVKTPIGTASGGVRLVTTRAELRQHAAQLDLRAGVLVQQPAIGPLIMIQSVFASGELVAFHACERVREGTNGGASHKRGISLPAARTHTAALGRALNWHGALSADVILTAEGPQFIDINPRLVEPANAFASGVDLVTALVEVARSGSGTPQPPGNPGVRTHQALIAILGAAARRGHRRDVLRELFHTLARSGDYRHSTEELTPIRWAGTALDPVTAIPVAAAVLATLVRPAAWHHFAAGATSAYSLSPAAWRALLGDQADDLPGATASYDREWASSHTEEATHMTAETETTAREQVRVVLHDHAAAITAKDAPRAVASYAPDVVSFILAPPLRYAGEDVCDPAGMRGWFQTWDGPIGYDIGEPVIEAGDDVAFCHGLTHLTGARTDGKREDLWFRSTTGLRRTAAGWRITHEHESTPFYMDGSGRAATDLKP